MAAAAVEPAPEQAGPAGTARTSRLCVKNLPKYVEDGRLREFFSSRGQVTDVKIMRTRDGNSRGFGFIGFTTVEAAADALKYYDKTYLDTTRLSVEYAQQFGKTTARPWSRLTPGSSAHAQAVREEADKERRTEPLKAREALKLKKQALAAASEGGIEADPRFQEFMYLMQPRSKQALWADGLPTSLGGQTAVAAAAAREEEAEVAGSESDEEYEDVRGVVAREEEEERGAEEETAALDDGVAADQAVSDSDYLRSRMRADFSDDEEEAGQDEEEEEEEGEGEEEEEGGGRPCSPIECSEDAVLLSSSPARPSAPSVLDTGRLFVRNLCYEATDAELRTLFEAFGEVESVHVALDSATRRSKGFAHVSFADPARAAAAQEALDGTIFQGRLLHILAGLPAPGSEPARALPAEEGAEDATGSRTYKAQAQAQRREAAGSRSDAASWNALFFRPDTAVAAVAAHLGVSKAALLDRESSDTAVRVALGEAQVAAATKQALADEGVDVGVLESAAQAGQSARSKLSRHDSVLLVKNLPWAADEEELRSLFARASGSREGGSLVRCILPPTKALALVEFEDAQAARAALRALAYRKYHGTPLYVQWAPAGVLVDGFVQKAPGARKTAPAAEKAGEESRKSAVAVAGESLGQGEDAAQPSATLFVKNLAWATADEALRALCKDLALRAGGAIRSASIAKRQGPGGKMLSAGYGFVECSSEAVARAVLEALQNQVLDGHKLIVQVSQKRDLAKEAASGTAPLTKLVVRNVAFQASRKDVLSLFAAFGEVKSCRLPHKFDGSHRGFAFLEFASAQEAKSAMEGVQGTHLYGRRLVVEPAQADVEDLEELRARSGEKSRAHVGPARRTTRQDSDDEPAMHGDILAKRRKA